jgi:uncharacterized membrane protein
MKPLLALIALLLVILICMLWPPMVLLVVGVYLYFVYVDWDTRLSEAFLELGEKKPAHMWTTLKASEVVIIITVWAATIWVASLPGL